MAGKDNTTRIGELEAKLAEASAKLASSVTAFEWASETLVRIRDSSESHHTKITIIEQQVLALAGLKDLASAVRAIEMELVGIKKDVESNTKWQEEEKKRQELWGQRFWLILPPLLAAILSTTLTAVLTYTFLRK